MNKLSKKNIYMIEAAVVAALLLTVIICSAVLFTQADRRSHDARVLDRAVLESTSIAETLKATDGDLQATGQMLRKHQLFTVSDEALTLYYDAEMNPSQKTASPYRATVKKTSSDPCPEYNITIWETETEQNIYTLSFKTVLRGDS